VSDYNFTVLETLNLDGSKFLQPSFRAVRPNAGFDSVQFSPLSAGPVHSDAWQNTTQSFRFQVVVVVVVVAVKRRLKRFVRRRVSTRQTTQSDDGKGAMTVQNCRAL